MEGDSTYVNKSLDRALRLLDLFNDSESALTASDIAERLGTTRATIYPTLHTLAAHGYLNRDQQGHFVLGMKIVERSGQKLADLDVRNIAQEPLRGLARRLNANAHLATLHGNEVLYLDREQGRPAVILREVIGRRVSPHCTALGKALLAFLPAADCTRIVRDLNYTAYTPHTITTLEALLAALEAVRRTGYALEIEEFHLGSACIAAPVRAHDGRVIAAISVSMAATDLTEQGPETLAAIIVNTAHEISAQLGYPGSTAGSKGKGGDRRPDSSARPRRCVHAPAGTCDQKQGGIEHA
jgi:IclR family transcriptional regulator, KDG regulon repressor